MHSDPGPFCQCRVDPTPSCWWNKALLEGITPCLWFTSAPRLQHTAASERHTLTHIIKSQRAQIRTHTHSTTHVTGIARAIILDWINYGHGIKSTGVSACLQRGAALFGMTCGQIISNELCKSPQSNTSRQWVMLTAPPTMGLYEYIHRTTKTKGESGGRHFT